MKQDAEENVSYLFILIIFIEINLICTWVMIGIVAVFSTFRIALNSTTFNTFLIGLQDFSNIFIHDLDFIGGIYFFFYVAAVVGRVIGVILEQLIKILENKFRNKLMTIIENNEKIVNLSERIIVPLVTLIERCQKLSVKKQIIIVIITTLLLSIPFTTLYFSFVNNQVFISLTGRPFLIFNNNESFPRMFCTLTFSEIWSLSSPRIASAFKSISSITLAQIWEGIIMPIIVIASGIEGTIALAVRLSKFFSKPVPSS